MRNRSLRWLAPLLIGACGVAGYAAGGGWDEAGKREAAAKSVILEQTRTVSRARRLEMDEFGGFEGLLSGRGKETDIWKVVSRLPVARIPDALRRLREARAVAASWTNDERRLDEIESAVYFRWAEADPKAALTDVVAMPESVEMIARMRKYLLMKSVLTAWMRTDPNAAYRAVKDNKNLEHYGRDLLVRTWTPANVFENLELYPENHQLLLGWYCIAASQNPARRNAMLLALKEQPKMQDRGWAYQLLFRGWGSQDFDAAMAEAEAQKVPGIMKQVLQDNLKTNPQKVMLWAAKHNKAPGGPQWEKGYSQWVAVDRQRATQWLAEQAPLWESHGYSGAVAGFLAQDFSNAEKMKLTTEQAAAAGKLTELMERWKNKDPEAAGKWLDTAPPAARKLLSGKGDAQ